MGTQGYVVFRYIGIYYIFYNSHDSYFSNLGQNFTNEINELLLDKEQWNALKYKLLRIPLHPNTFTDGEATYYVDYISSFQYMTSYEEQYYAEYVYTLDMDNNEFIVNKHGERVVFKLKFDGQLPHDLEEWWSHKNDQLSESADEADDEKIRILEAQIKNLS